MSDETGYDRKQISILTPVQQKALVAIEDYIREKRMAPTIRELERIMGYTSPAPVQSLVCHLERKGYISKIKGCPRTIQILRSASDNLDEASQDGTHPHRIDSDNGADAASDAVSR